MKDTYSKMLMSTQDLITRVCSKHEWALLNHIPALRSLFDHYHSQRKESGQGRVGILNVTSTKMRCYLPTTCYEEKSHLHMLSTVTDIHARPMLWLGVTI